MLRLVLRRVGLAGEDDDHRILALDLRQPAQSTGVVGQLVVGERHSRSDVSTHRHASSW
jgi:hypothetical protein